VQQLEGGVIRHGISADPGERLREGADHEIDRIEHPLLFGTTQTVVTVSAERVRFVDHQPGAGGAARGRDLAQRGHVPAYRIQAFDDHQAGARIAYLFQLSRQVGGRIVAKDEHPRAAQPGTVVDARMALDIDDDRVFRAAQAGNHPEVRLVTGREHHRMAHAVELGKQLFEVAVRSECAVCGA
jgi:hypothetical protein